MDVASINCLYQRTAHWESNTPNTHNDINLRLDFLIVRANPEWVYINFQQPTHCCDTSKTNLFYLALFVMFSLIAQTKLHGTFSTAQIEFCREGWSRWKERKKEDKGTQIKRERKNSENRGKITTKATNRLCFAYISISAVINHWYSPIPIDLFLLLDFWLFSISHQSISPFKIHAWKTIKFWRCSAQAADLGFKNYAAEVLQRGKTKESNGGGK